MRISIILDLISGLLIGADLLIPAHYLKLSDARLQKPLHRNIKELLSDKREGAIRRLSIILILFLLFFITPFFAVEISKDIDSASFTSRELLSTYGLLALGLVISVVVWNYSFMFLSNRMKPVVSPGKRSGRKFAVLISERWAVAIIISVLAVFILFIILVFAKSATYMVPIMIGVTVGSPYALFLILLISFISSRKGIIARIGIVLFIVSKIVELAYSY